MRARARAERTLLRERRRFHGRLGVWPRAPRHLYTLVAGMPRPGRDPYWPPFPGVGV